MTAENSQRIETARGATLVIRRVGGPVSPLVAVSVLNALLAPRKDLLNFACPQTGCVGVLTVQVVLEVGSRAAPTCPECGTECPVVIEAAYYDFSPERTAAVTHVEASEAIRDALKVARRLRRSADYQERFEQGGGCSGDLADAADAIDTLVKVVELLLSGLAAESET